MDSIRLIETDALNTRRRDLVCPEGKTVLEIIQDMGIEGRRAPLRVFVGDRLIQEGAWSDFRPRAGQSVVVTTVPEGGEGGNKAIRTVAIIGVAVVAALAGGYTAAAFEAAKWGAGASAGFGALAAGAVSVAGFLAVNAIVPPATPQISNSQWNSDPSPV